MANQQNEDDDYTIALVLQEFEDHALAQAIADSQREEIYRQQQTPKQNWLDSEREYRQQRQQQTIREIPGGKAVTHQVINKYINNCEKDCDDCRLMMQNVRVIVTNIEAEENTRLENFEVKCYGEHFTLVFWSGKRTNKMVVKTVAGKTHVSVTEESWQMWFKKVVKKCWNSLKNAALKILNKVGGVAIAGVIFKAIGM